MGIPAAPQRAVDHGKLRTAQTGGPMAARVLRELRNVIVTPFEVKQMQALRDHPRNEFDQRHASPVKSASRSRIHSTTGT